MILHVWFAELPAPLYDGNVVALAFCFTFGMQDVRFGGLAHTAAVGEAGGQPASRVATPGSGAVEGD